MQSLEVISINIWDILISLCNLLVIFLILKKFVFAPVQKVLNNRAAQLEQTRKDAEKAKSDALASQTAYREKLAGARGEADALIEKAKADAERRGDSIVAEAKDRADALMENAKVQIANEQKNAETRMKNEIAQLSAELAEKLIQREINPEDHREFIDSFIDSIGTAEEHNG